jgi:hypothetical protein
VANNKHVRECCPPADGVVVLVSGSERDQVMPHLARSPRSRAPHLCRPSDSRVPIESADVVLPRRPRRVADRERGGRAARADVGPDRARPGRREPAGLVDEALEASLSDILILPQPPDVIAFSLRKAAASAPAARRGVSAVMMVSSTKGGTGKTSIAVNVAVASPSCGCGRC